MKARVFRDLQNTFVSIDMEGLDYQQREWLNFVSFFTVLKI